MIGTGGLEGEQQKNEIDRLVIERLEIDCPLEASEQSYQPAKPGHLAMRDRHAISHGRRAELLTLKQNLQNCLLALVGELRGMRGKFLDRLLLAIDFEGRDDCVRRDEVGERHGHVR